MLSQTAHRHTVCTQDVPVYCPEVFHMVSLYCHCVIPKNKHYTFFICLYVMIIKKHTHTAKKRFHFMCVDQDRDLIQENTHDNISDL